MKSILLATAASVAFAGAAAAEVTFSGTAAASFNNNEGYAWETDLKASMSAELDNGLTATASLSFATDDSATAETTGGNITVAGANASIAFGSDLQNGVYKAIGDSYDMGGVEDGFTGIVASYSMGDATVYADVALAANAKSVASKDFAFAAKTTVSGWAVSGAAAQVSGKTEVGVKFSGAVAGATISGGFGTVDAASGKAQQYDVKVAYPVGPVTVSAKIDQDNKYTIGGAYAADGVSIAAEYADSSTIAATWTVDASYEVATGVKVLAGLGDNGADKYIGATYALGGGASLLASYGVDEDGDANNEIGAPDYKKGATVKVSFAF